MIRYSNDSSFITHHSSFDCLRYFIHLAYNGTRFCGWQRQPNDPSIQEVIETQLSLLLREQMEVSGCGRTDTGVHALCYYAHFETEKNFTPDDLAFRLNKIVGDDIVVEEIFPVGAEMHARFSATHRSYEYYISSKKNPFQLETVWQIPFLDKLDKEKMQTAARLLLEYKAFAPFCKTHSDAQTMLCDLTQSNWEFSEDGACFQITSNRFLRGMVRLIVGMCINVGSGQMTIEEVRTALETQTPLKKSYSVPSTGLFLSDVRYADIHNI